LAINDGLTARNGRAKNPSCERWRATILNVAQLKQAAFRVDDELMKRLDRMVGVLQRSPDYAGMEVTRSTAIRTLVLRGLASFELRHGLKDDLPQDLTLPTDAYWNRSEQEAAQELEAIRRFIDERTSRQARDYMEVVGEPLDEPWEPRSQFYKSKLKK
jgi:hypothetical protein